MSDKPSLDEQINVVRQCRKSFFSNIPHGLDPTFYHTLTAQGDEAAQRQLDAVVDTLQRHKLALEMLDDALHYDTGDLLYDQQSVNVAHRVLSGGELPRETET